MHPIGEGVNQYEGVSVYDKTKKERVYLKYGRNNFISPVKLEKSQIDDRELKKVLESGEELLLYQIEVEQIRGIVGIRTQEPSVDPWQWVQNNRKKSKSSRKISKETTNPS
jgi:hypothetical protein